MSGFRLDMKAWAALVGVTLTICGFVYASGGTVGTQKQEIKQAQEAIQQHDEKITQINANKADKQDLQRLESKIDKLGDKIDSFIEREIDRTPQPPRYGHERK